MNSIHLFTVELLLMTLMFLALSYNIVILRRKYLTPIGDGGFTALARAISAQRNFIDYALFGLILHLTLVVVHANVIILGSLILMLIIGRLLHFYSIIIAEVREKPRYRYRRWGMYLTFTSILGSALYVTWFTLITS